MVKIKIQVKQNKANNLYPKKMIIKIQEGKTKQILLFDTAYKIE